MGSPVAITPDLAIPAPRRKPLYQQLYVQVLAAIALGACRRETPVDSYEPMKLGVTVDKNRAN